MVVSSIEEILLEFKNGNFVIMVDHIDRENEGDLMFAAEFANAQKINFMLKESRGLICLAIQQQQVERLKLPLMSSSQHRSNHNHAAFTFSIEASVGITTGISASERALTIQTAIKRTATSQDVVCPGHVFPLVAKSGGVLEREGHTEASVDLAQLSDLNPASVICEILDDEGNAAKNAYLAQFSKKFNIKIGSVDDLVIYRKSLQNTL